MNTQALIARSVKCIHENLCFISLKKLTEDSIVVRYASIDALVSVNTEYIKF
jgi:hypothetical protein